MLDMLSEECMLGCKAANALIKANVKLLPDLGDILDDPGTYHQLVGKLNYLTIIRPGIAFVVDIVSQFLSAQRTTHWDAVVQFLRYLKKVPGKRASIFKLCTYQLLIFQMLDEQDHQLISDLP